MICRLLASSSISSRRILPVMAEFFVCGIRSVPNVGQYPLNDLSLAVLSSLDQYDRHFPGTFSPL
jgi:hypothetical protein